MKRKTFLALTGMLWCSIVLGTAILADAPYRTQLKPVIRQSARLDSHLKEGLSALEKASKTGEKEQLNLRMTALLAVLEKAEEEANGMKSGVEALVSGSGQAISAADLERLGEVRSDINEILNSIRHARTKSREIMDRDIHEQAGYRVAKIKGIITEIEELNQLVSVNLNKLAQK